jgi:hypothetical protein
MTARAVPAGRARPSSHRCRAITTGKPPFQAGLVVNLGAPVQFAIQIPLNRRHGAKGIAKVMTGERTQRLGIDVVVRLDAVPALDHLMVLEEAQRSMRRTWDRERVGHNRSGR